MRIALDADHQFENPRTRHREPNIRFKRLLKGERDSPQNYELMIAKTDGHYLAPRHHHNFDQIRIGLTGEFGDGKRQIVKSGGIGYYPEGAYYAIDSAETEVLLLQFGGAGGYGFTHFDQLYAAYGEMAQLGNFRNGVFFRHDRSNLPPDVKPNQDGYEALWQHIHGRPVTYPTPRYEEPIIMNPEGFAWLPDTEQPGVRRRTAGIFTERLIEIAQLEVAGGATWTEPAPRAPKLLYIVSGHALASDGATLPAGTAIEIGRGEQLVASAAEPLLAFTITLPAFSDEEIAARRPPDRLAA